MKAITDFEAVTRTVTFLMSDVEGSTRKWELTPDAMRRAMTRLDSLMEDVVRRSEGELVKERGEGDSHFVVFADPRSAAKCALDIQQELLKQDWGELHEIKTRIALHTGDAEFRGGDYYGPSVNRCARIRAASHGGQIILSEATQALVARSLPEGARLINLGEHRFRDLLEPERIYQLVGEGLPTQFPPLNSIDSSRNNLPIQLTSFIGRDKELADLHRLIKKSRLVTLTGAGGCGKTRLSLQSAAEFVNEMPDGVWFIELVGLTDGRLIPQTIAEAIHVSLTGDSPIDSLIDELKDLSCMLVLDNCEHLLSDVTPLVSRLQRTCRNLKILASSRERLAVTGEQIFLVPPLECDLRGEEASLERVSSMDSVKLLCERAASRTSDQILREDSAEDVARLCKKLEGIPLAIEQAASNLPYLSPAQILDRLEQHLSVLTMDEADVDPRHKTLTATLDWSYEMLNEKERLLFHRLGVFVGGSTLEACEAICSTDGLERKEIFPLLQRLIGKSLAITELTPGGSRRYRLLEPVREYIIDRSQPSDELLERHFDWHQHLAKAAYEGGLDAENNRWLRILSVEHDNIRAALHFQKDRSHAAGLQASIWLNRFWLRRGYINEGLRWLQTFVDCSSELDTNLRAESLNVLGVFSWQAGRLDAAELALSESLNLWRSTGNAPKVTAVLHNLAILAFTRRDLRVARDRFLQCAKRFESYDDKARLANSLENLGVVEHQLGQLTEALAHLQQASVIHREMEDDTLVAKCLASRVAIGLEAGIRCGLADACIEACSIALESVDPYLKWQIASMTALVSVHLDDPVLAARALGALGALRSKCESNILFAEREVVARVECKTAKLLSAKDYHSELRIGKRMGERVLLQFVSKLRALES